MASPPTAKISITRVEFGPEEESSVLDVLRSGQVAQGPRVEQLEAAFRDLVGVEHAIAMSSGTTALVAALQALDLTDGAEVVTSPFTFIATVNAVLEAGATVTFSDIGDDFTLDPAGVAAAVTDATAAIMPVHLYGLPADMVAIGAVARAHDLHLVEDACQAHGALVAGRPVGSFGVGCFSLYATKNVSSGEGGMVTTDDAALADRLRLLRNQGMRARYEYVMAGHNYRLTDLQAALAIPQLGRLADATERRRQNAEKLTAGLAGLPGLVLPETPVDRTHVWHQYTVRVSEGARLDRDALGAALDTFGIGTSVFYPRVAFDYDCYRTHPRVRVAEVPNARRAASEVLSLPVHPGLGDDDVDRIIDVVRMLLAP